jgi:ribonuclease T
MAAARVVSNGVHPAALRFRGYLPVVIDVETGGFNPRTDALLEIAAVILTHDNTGGWRPAETVAFHVQPFAGARLDESALKFNGIDPYHPLRIAVPEDHALREIFRAVRAAVRQHDCQRAILVGHNAAFDLSFVNTVAERAGLKRNPFHPFSAFDTATLAGLAYGQTVLARALEAAGIEWDEGRAHSARYDAERTAELFCAIVNRWDAMNGG